MQAAWKSVVKTSVILLGILLLVAGVLMLFLPAPGVLAVVTGLAILARYFAWAAQALRWTSERVQVVRSWTARVLYHHAR